jgi:predicted amidophosphoribosyltransferase
MPLPSIEAPEPGTLCPDCGRELQIIDPRYCGACAEHERRRDDPLRLEESALIARLADQRGEP